ncbi:zinc ribbon domain-containing protein [Allocoprobacillus halotolerans]|uniref:Zinc ribbon domain-containing protein n=1 Tax=Allocoprobacillus halotolerans TaxID=2944914 RepID=A0ABY5I6B4_9FIRM|nr:zinc ribbon domain-containing protein [Allocoprobacillus halotolerans]UTY39583.1 zinc ribbon domain-containing protein [Allocoprobacillus halotolerans]
MKKIWKTLSLLLAVFLLTGCMKMKVNLEVKADKSMTGSMDLLFEESLLEMSGTSTDEAIEQLKEEMQSTEGMENAKITSIDETINGSQWAGVHIDGLDASSQEMQAVITEEEVDGEDCIVFRMPLDEFENQMDAELTDSLGYSVSKIKELGIEMVMTIQMPGDAKSNFGTVDGQTVTIDLLELSTGTNSNRELVISSPKSVGMNMTYVYVGIGALVVIGIVAFILKNKKKTDQMITHDETVENTDVETQDNSEEMTQSDNTDSTDENMENTEVETQANVTSETSQDNSEETTQTDSTDENNG